ncbi:phage tail protein [Massilia sp. Root351]|jgi:microcystin-dependent protein|uniref:phage tail protein n=1 Tax=Massilia sp. Root351 TaxID=1736522 RepID=UPI0007097991|nr:tail fiber protein [Massilia sp. Root351]KQV86282.1 phage tail protein [Massilia sp. Root351]
MADPFVAEIRIFPFNFAPKGWAFCDGQLLPLSQNTALFSLLGTAYGGDGRSTFALPDLRDSYAMGVGQGQGLSERYLGEKLGEETVTLLPSEIPAHAHAQGLGGSPAGYSVPGPSAVMGTTPGVQLYSASGATAYAYTGAMAAAGGGQPHNNRQPTLGLYFCIALQGVFPQRP